MVNFNIFTLHPRLFDSFKSEGLIARAISKDILSINPINWREKYGVGNYRQVDDRPYGGGTGMVLQVEQIYQALKDANGISPLFKPNNVPGEHARLYPRNPEFFEYWQKNKTLNKAPRSVTISMTPRGYQFNQQIAEWLSGNFDTINVLCGRYEGFDSRASEIVDLELSMGPYVTNGGEIPSMVLMEAVSRLLPDFVTKNPSVMHDSFSSSLNEYGELEDYVVGVRRKKQLLEVGDPNNKLGDKSDNEESENNLFDIEQYLKTIAPFVEHTQFTRPKEWNGYQVPNVLLGGDHKAIAKWRNESADPKNNLAEY